MESSSAIVYLLMFVSAILNCIYVVADGNTFNIMEHGAIGNGIADDTKAMEETWNNTCNVVGNSATLIIPGGKTFLVHAIEFLGPCKPAKINIVISGTIIAPNGPNEWNAQDQSKWLHFGDVAGLNIYGGGRIDGRGKGWWDNSCRYYHKQGCTTLAPTALEFVGCKYVQVNNISIVNSPQTHITSLGCNNMNFGYLDLQSPGESPNTDGIHVQISHDVLIHNSNIGSGDDCVSIGDITSTINVTDVNCGPGHGVSIGSLGRGGSQVQVQNITVTRVNFTGTTNGARIKTWPVGRGGVKFVEFSHLTFTEVENPIIIDQYYGDPTSVRKGSGVHISNVAYRWLSGTSETIAAINLNCSSTTPCTDITLDNIQLTSATPKTKLVSSCNYAHGTAQGIVEPTSCLHA